MQLGMIGLGRMGGNMTKRLAERGHDMKTYDPQRRVDGEDARGASRPARRAALVLDDGARREDHRGHVPDAARARGAG